MNKNFARVLSLALCAAVVCALPAFAAEMKGANAPDYLAPVRVWGTVTRLENGAILLKNANENDPYREVILHLTEAAPVVDAVTGLPLDRELRDGETVYAWMGPAMTLSLPPQANAEVVVANIPAGFAVPQYYEIAKVQPRVTAAIYPPPPTTRVDLVTTGGEELTVTDQAELTPYRTKQMLTLDALSPGAHILVWKNGGAVSKVLVFAYQYRGWIAWEPTGEVSVYDRRLPVAGKVADGQVLLPIRAVAEAADYKVDWVTGRGAVVSRFRGGEVFSVLPGQDVARTPDGETDLSAPVVYDSGVTYMAADDLARLLDLFRTY